MLKPLLLAATLGLLSASACAASSTMQIQTSMGTIEIELFDDQAPISVENFKKYTQAHFYQGTIFHRVIPGFMIQGGGFDAQMQQKPTRPPIKNEAANGLKNTRGTLAMARTNHPNSATSQFFINVAENDFLNKNNMNDGYAVFGKVTKGMEVVDQIAKVPTTSVGPHQDVPVKPVEILSITSIGHKTKP